ncbi:MAG: DUF349 domain-containing protein [Micrococcales bacterium]
MSNKFGRVDAENNVYVFELGSERQVGQFLNGTADQALAYYETKFADLEAQVRILEQRIAAKVDAPNIASQHAKLVADLVEPAAVGDLNSLRTRVAALAPKIAELGAKRQEANKEATAKALEARVAIAVAAEQIANQDASKTQWKQSAEKMTALFTQWQELQKSGGRVNKTDADPIWKRFSTARSRFEIAKRSYFASLDSNNKAVRAKKNSIVEEAEKLAASGSDAINDYRKLLDQWKTSGRTPGKSDDALWARFKAAGDAIYSKRQETAVVENAEQTANYEAKKALLAQYSAIDAKTNLQQAKQQLQELAKKWEKIGRVPKDKIREVEDKLRALESKVREVEQDHWRKTDPASIERSNSVVAQLEAGIAKLEAELETAKKSGNDKAIKSATEALEARKAWMAAVKAASN